tara:strand:+ start:1148 stop:1369 length:222 start_codon:yes stop_codon:yes gene_type:complete
MSNKHPINVETKPKPNESIERTLKRFSRKVKKEGILDQLRERSRFEKPSDKKRRLAKKRKAVLRRLKQKEQTS